MNEKPVIDEANKVGWIEADPEKNGGNRFWIADRDLNSPEWVKEDGYSRLLQRVGIKESSNGYGLVMAYAYNDTAELDRGIVSSYSVESYDRSREFYDPSNTIHFPTIGQAQVCAQELISLFENSTDRYDWNGRQYNYETGHWTIIKE